MSNKKSLGSSPIGLKSENNSMGFIPDLGVADSKKQFDTSSDTKVKRRQKEELQNHTEEKVTEKKKRKKKVVSYNLEIELIKKIKAMATKRDVFYSTLVSNALKSWISRHTDS